jgi:hypothetical protein
MVYSTPLVEKVHHEPTIYFGPESSLQERYDDEEVQGGKIALIAFKQRRVQKPPNGLDRMQSTFSKQVAYNQRILAAESEIAGYNCDIPHFFEDMTIEEPVYVCINSSQELRDEQAIAGQLWIQGNRHLTASNTVPEGMADTSDSAVLAAVAEAVTWTHASQPPDESKKGERIIIFPKELFQLEEFLATTDPSVDPDDGHPIAYAKILEESRKFEIAPKFIKEDSEVVANDPVLNGWPKPSRSQLEATNVY